MPVGIPRTVLRMAMRPRSGVAWRWRSTAQQPSPRLRVDRSRLPAGGSPGSRRAVVHDVGAAVGLGEAISRPRLRVSPAVSRSGTGWRGLGRKVSTWQVAAVSGSGTAQLRDRAPQHRSAARTVIVGQQFHLRCRVAVSSGRSAPGTAPPQSRAPASVWSPDTAGATGGVGVPVVERRHLPRSAPGAASPRRGSVDIAGMGEAGNPVRAVWDGVRGRRRSSSSGLS